jgi:TolB-like protein
MDEASFFNLQIHEMALQLMKNFRAEPGPEGPIAVATFVDLNNLYRTSPFGRYLAEQLMGELQRAGFNVVEIRKTESIMIKKKFGEYGLSREVQEIAQESSASYILAGTYVTRGRFILVNARLISNQNNLVASSGLKILRRDPFLDKMLWPTATPESGQAVRIPVKELGHLSDIKILSES